MGLVSLIYHFRNQRGLSSIHFEFDIFTLKKKSMIAAACISETLNVREPI